MLHKTQHSSMFRWTSHVLIAIQIAIVCLHSLHVHSHVHHAHSGEHECIHVCEHTGATKGAAFTPFHPAETIDEENCSVCHLLSIQLRTLTPSSAPAIYPSVNTTVWVNQTTIQPLYSNDRDSRAPPA